jgi:hypothetical protein
MRHGGHEVQPLPHGGKRNRMQAEATDASVGPARKKKAQDAAEDPRRDRSAKHRGKSSRAESDEADALEGQVRKRKLQDHGAPRNDATNEMEDAGKCTDEARKSPARKRRATTADGGPGPPPGAPTTARIPGLPPDLKCPSPKWKQMGRKYRNAQGLSHHMGRCCPELRDVLRSPNGARGGWLPFRVRDARRRLSMYSSGAPLLRLCGRPFWWGQLRMKRNGVRQCLMPERLNSCGWQGEEGCRQRLWRGRSRGNVEGTGTPPTRLSPARRLSAHRANRLS